MLKCLFLLIYLNLPPVPPVFSQIDSVKTLQKRQKKTAGRIMAGRFLGDDPDLDHLFLSGPF
jgi:hypothetical protein